MIRIASLALFLFLMQTSSWGQIITDFHAAIQKGCAPLAVKFEDRTVGNPVKWEWDFGNGNKSTLQNPSAVYIQSGIYSVSLTTENASGQKNTKTLTSYIEVFKNPVAQFTTNSNQVCINTPIQFNNTSQPGSRNITQNLWDFGDGTLVNSPNPLHAYAQEGFKNITLIVRDVNNCESVLKRDSLLFVFPHYPFDFTVDKTYDCKLPTPVAFQFTGSSNIASYQWDFGDGNSSSAKNPTHQYTAHGAYDVKLMVKDKNNCFDTVSKSNAFIASKINPSFSLSNQGVCFDQEVEITNTTQHTLPHEPKWKWIFEEGAAQTTKNAYQTYKKEGVYAIKLLVQDSLGRCFDSVHSTVNIEFKTKPNIVPVFEDSQFCTFPSRIQFKPSSNVIKAFWRFTTEVGDTSNKINPQFTYNQTGNYTLHYQFLAPNGCWIIDSLVNGIEVATAGFELIGDSEGCIPKSIPYSGVLNGKYDLQSFRIFLNDTLFPEDKHYGVFQNGRTVGVSVPLDKPGSGKVHIEVTNTRGCTYIDSVIYSFGEKTEPKFEFLDTVLCVYNSIYIKNLTDSTDKKVQSYWKFTDDKDTVPMWDGVYRYEELGKHSISLITGNYTCFDTLRLDTIIDIKGPKAGIGVKKDPCTGLTTVSNTSIEYTRYEWYVDNVLRPDLQDSFQLNLLDAEKAILVKIIAYNDSNDCPPDSLIELITPVYKLKADFEIVTSGKCAPLNVQLRNLSHSKVLFASDRYFWYINNEKIPVFNPDSMQSLYALSLLNYENGEPKNASPRIVITENGNYQVKLIANRVGCLETLVKDIIIDYPIPTQHVVNWSGDCVPVTVNLKDFNPNYTRSVRLGNGESHHNVPPDFTYTYNNASPSGFYNFLVTFTDDKGCSKWEQYRIPVGGPGVSLSFTNETKACEQPVYSFASILLRNPNGGGTFQWDMGEGSKLNGEKVQHQYDSSGTYKVTLTYTDNAGCKAQNTLHLIHQKQELRALISADTTTSPCPPLFVNFKNNSVTRSGIPIVAYNWDFGDGTYSTLQNPSKTYTRVGKYTVRLSITDAAGCVHNANINDFIVVKGPTGSYNFTPREGCVPHQVLFSVKSSSPNDTYYWDLGDGETFTESVFYKTYQQTGVYTPFIFLTDSNGCRNPLPAIGTIKVNPNPIANFVTEQLCQNKPTRFIDQTQHFGLPITQYNWHIDNKQIQEKQVQYVFNKNGNHNIKLHVRSSANCVDSITKTIKIYGFNPKIEVDSNKICLGESARFFNKSLADSFINPSKTAWFYNGQKIGSGQDLIFIPPQKGLINLGLYMQDVMGCDTTIEIKKVLLVGDTLSPPHLDMLHVSVIDDYNLQVKFKPTLEPDFKHYHLYWRDSLAQLQKIKTSSLEADTLLQASQFPTLHKVHCFAVVQENICSLKAEPEEAEWHCSVEVKGNVDSNRSILHWTPYIGWDTVDRYIVYKQDPRNSNLFDSIGQVPGHIYEFIDSVDCYTDLFSYRIKAIEKAGHLEQSWSDTCKVQPIYAPYVYPPYYLVGSVPDNQNISSEIVELKESRKPIAYYKVERALQPHSYRQIGNAIKQNPSTLFIDSGSIDVQKHSYYYRVKAVDVCDDESVVSNYGKTILLKSKLNEAFKPVLYWTPYEYWEESVDYYIIEKEVSEGVFEQIGKTINGNDTQFTHSDLSNNCSQRYRYRVKGVRNAADTDSKYSYENVVSISNITTAPVESRIFAPNAFSPNKDGLNEVLEFKGIFINEFILQVYNRWGEKLYESTDCYPTWDATFKGEPVPSGVYVYKLKAIGADGILHSIAQDVTLLR